MEGSSESRLGSVTKFKPRIKVTVILGDYLLVADLGSLQPLLSLNYNEAAPLPGLSGAAPFFVRISLTEP